MRQKFQESLGETSGAVEIDVEQLDRFERGAELPSEDILMLLINHFGLPDEEAVKLWEMAGYDQSTNLMVTEVELDGHRHGDHLEAAGRGMPVVLLAFDNRILYSNGLEIVSDEVGMVLNFSQVAGSSQPSLVSRVGISYEQAEQMILTMQRALLHKKYLSGPKQLPPPSN